MIKKSFSDFIKFGEVKDLKTRFEFVENEILKENLAIKLQHIIFLLYLEEKYELPGALTYSTFKTIIIFTASIVECLIHYKIEKLLASGHLELDIMGKEDKYSNWKELYKISDKEKIYAVKKVIKIKKLSDDTNFIDLNKAAKRSGLFTEKLFNDAEKIRKMRNRIHPYGLKEIDDKYSKKEINDIFEITAKIIERIVSY